jgi:pimeloyl-ACP methyl ester carboxylesterase
MSFRVALGILLSMAASAGATAHEAVVPLNQGKVPISQLNASISDALHVSNFPSSDVVELAGPGSTDALTAINACMWRGSSIELRGNVAVVHLAELPAESWCRRASRMTRIITAEKYPAATAMQARRWGLLLPQNFKPDRPLIVFVHGLDVDRNYCFPMGELATQAGWQVGYFGYPGDQPIDDSASLFARSIHDLQTRYPKTRIDIVAHSMGGLVARGYVEGPDYTIGVERLILIAPPNAGSGWARARTALSIQENYYLRQCEPQWRWTWLITEGMGEAGSDLLPGSEFLNQLNARPRRASVKYTIIAGSHSPVSNVEAYCIECIQCCIPSFARSWWGVGSCYRGLESKSQRLRAETGDSDGVVTQESARIDGVKDFVILPADHRTLFLPEDGKLPAAWAIVKDRLSR